MKSDGNGSRPKHDYILVWIAEILGIWVYNVYYDGLKFIFKSNAMQQVKWIMFWKKFPALDFD